jgi:hypothetical protein
MLAVLPTVPVRRYPFLLIVAGDTAIVDVKASGVNQYQAKSAPIQCRTSIEIFFGFQCRLNEGKLKHL